jgi:hypothetical protein
MDSSENEDLALEMEALHITYATELCTLCESPMRLSMTIDPHADGSNSDSCFVRATLVLTVPPGYPGAPALVELSDAKGERRRPTLAGTELELVDGRQLQGPCLTTSRTPLVLFGIQNRTLDPYFAALHRILTTAGYAPTVEQFQGFENCQGPFVLQA